MKISFVRIRNFRNFRNLEVELDHIAVIVGENASGKSNFLEAVRLVLDPSLSDQDRILSKDDFWDGDPQTVSAFYGTCIEVTIRISDMDNKLLSLLHDPAIPVDKHKQEPVAEISYRFEPDITKKVKSKDARATDYTFNFYRLKPKNLKMAEILTDNWAESHELIKNMSEIRRRLVFLVIPALRDIENSLLSWRRSPLRRLIERLELPQDKDFIAVTSELKETTQNLRGIPVVENLEFDMRKRLYKMLRGVYQVAPRLGFAPVDEAQLSRSLRLFVDGDRWRSVSSTSLGIANILFLTLLNLDAEKRKNEENEYVILSIEEPEAHLHPQLQRLVYRDYFDLVEESGQPMIVTTHSPHIASVAPLSSILLIKKCGSESKAFSTADLALEEIEKRDLRRYLDNTKSEIFFARGVILVEGIAEVFLVQAFAKGIKISEISQDEGNKLLEEKQASLDQFGISICSIGGVGFRPYVKFLSSLNIPFVVITDGDEYIDETGSTKFMGLKRGIDLVSCIDSQKGKKLSLCYEDGKVNCVRKLLASSGIFVNRSTLEIELLQSGHGNSFMETFLAIGIGENLKVKISTWIDEIISGDCNNSQKAIKELMSRIENYPCYGKGRFAQILADKINPIQVPGYISEAIQYIVNKY